MATTTEIILLRIKSALGNPYALYGLGHNYLYGIGVPCDIQKAYHLIEKARKKGLEEAESCIKSTFEIHDDGSVTLDSDFEKIYEPVKQMTLAAENGDPFAQWMRGHVKFDEGTSDYMYQRGLCWVKKAAKQDFPLALYSLAVEYIKEKRIKGKRNEGIEMMKKAARLGAMPAIKFIANFFSPSDAIPLLVKKADEGDAEAMGMLGTAYLQGEGVEQDHVKGVELINKAADKGDRYSVFNMALFYEKGQYGVEKNIHKAISLFEKLVSDGDVDSMNILGEILEKSEDVEHDYVRAFELYKRAADLDDTAGYNNVATCYKRGIGTEV